MVELILGGARSGKSSLAETLAFNQAGDDVLYIATATVIDDEMAKRIERHRLDRPQSWQVIESPLELAQAINDNTSAKTLLVDCLTLWLNNHLYEKPEQDFQTLFKELIEAAKQAEHIIFVANEVGLGVIPMGELSRRFVDEAGRLNRQLAQAADRVVFVVAGIPQVIKGEAL